jgi:hypothetical protein
MNQLVKRCFHSSGWYNESFVVGNLCGRFSTIQKAAYIKYLPMPRLSPSMESGTVKKWFIRSNDSVQSYQLILEVVAKQVRKSSSPETEYTMEIELLEDMYLADLLAKEGEECVVGQPIAVFCDNEEDIENVRSHPVSYFLRLQGWY